MYTCRHELSSIPPFDFNLSARSFSTGDAQIQKYKNGKYWQIIRVKGSLVHLSVRGLGTVDSPLLLVKLQSRKELSASDQKVALDTVRFIFNLQLDLNSFYEEVQNDKILTKVVQHLRGLKTISTATPFEALVLSIIEQQISQKTAHRIEQKFVKQFGDVLQIDGDSYYAFPAPGKLASARTTELREFGLTQRKAEYICEASQKVADSTLDFEKLRSYDDVNDIINELRKIRGIGIWTAQMTAVRGLQRLDYYPGGDLGLRRVVSYYYCRGRKVTNHQINKIAEKWGTLKGIAKSYIMAAGREKVPV
jgi:DNA-3-methyladenine glycosylase II